MKTLLVRTESAWLHIRTGLGRRIAKSKRREIGELQNHVVALRALVKEVTGQQVLLAARVEMQELAEAERQAFEMIRRHEDRNW